jgi:nitrate/TMAO reductase-like tetraheme cytochrome c subunit
MLDRLWNWVPNLWSNPISLLGSVLATVAGVALLVMLGVDVAGATTSPYTAAFLMIAVPGLFVAGLLLIPLGLWIFRRSRAQRGLVPLNLAVAALFTTPAGRRKLIVVGGLTLVNLLIVSVATAKAVHWMDSPEFCGKACHTVMEPEWESYKDSPHARVACVDCHIGPGVSFLIRSKIDGLRQVWHTIRGDYSRPVPTPVHTLRPSQDICEKCHWPDKFHGNRLLYRLHTRPDEANTQEANVLLLKVGGRDPTSGEYHGIHWHVATDSDVVYEALDEKREVIGKITVIRDGKVVEEYLPPEDAKGAVVETRTMDCIDCHNRPTHRYDLSPALALDRGFRQGTVDASVPWLRKVAEPLLERQDMTRDGAERALRADLEAAYKAQHPDKVPAADVLDKAARGLAELWKDNVFPERGVTWGTYANHIGHKSATPMKHGCYRCHDDKHKTASGKVLSGDCENCHEQLAQEETLDELDDLVKSLLPK